MKTILAADLFCGAGGTTTGLLLACKELSLHASVLAVNHWNIAIDTHTRNHPGVRHLCESLDNLDPRKVVPHGRLDLLCASPECTHHSIARGGKPCSDQSRATAWHICRWAEALRIENILIENVREFQNWGPLTKKGKPMKSRRGQTYLAFLNALRSLGYEVETKVVNAADFGDATTRHRLFIMARRGKKVAWPESTHIGRWRAAKEIIDFSIAGKSIFKRDRPLSENTLRRIAAGLKKFGGEAFLVNFHGGPGGDKRVNSVENPLPTQDCQNRFGLAEPFILQTDQTGGNGDYVRGTDKPLYTMVTKSNLALVEPFIVNLRGTKKEQLETSADSTAKPLRSLTTSGAHVALVEPFLVKYYGNGVNAESIHEPIATITGNDRFGLVQPEGMDIHFRMLQPHELARAMSFPDGYQFAGNRENRVKQIGNAVPVRTAAALCKALLS